MELEKRINAFVELGKFLNQFKQSEIKKDAFVKYNDLFFDGFNHQLKLAQESNAWFTKDNIFFSLDGWAKQLTYSNINKFLLNYNMTNVLSKNIAIIMAGNIPLVGFHDFFSVLISGHKVTVKQSTNDKQLLPFIAKYLEIIEPSFKSKITFIDGQLDEFDAVIATGSDNTARYFEYYFREVPSIIRRNRNSVAVLTGHETQDELEALSDDIFRYFGLGCRNVSKLFIPNSYDFKTFFKSVYKWHPIIHQSKYANNYDYNKAVYLMSEFDMLENGFLMLKEDHRYSSPIATLFYEFYDSKKTLKKRLNKDHTKIQCVVASNFLDSEIKFGCTQTPNLWDFADNVDTIEFLLKI